MRKYFMHINGDIQIKIKKQTKNNFLLFNLFSNVIRKISVSIFCVKM